MGWKPSYLLEVGSGGENFVNEIFDGKDIVFSEGGFDDLIVGQRHSLLVNSAVTTLVDQLADSLQVRLSIWVY